MQVAALVERFRPQPHLRPGDLPAAHAATHNLIHTAVTVIGALVAVFAERPAEFG